MSVLFSLSIFEILSQASFDIELSPSLILRIQIFKCLKLLFLLNPSITAIVPSSSSLLHPILFTVLYQYQAISNLYLILSPFHLCIMGNLPFFSLTMVVFLPKSFSPSPLDPKISKCTLPLLLSLTSISLMKFPILESNVVLAILFKHSIYKDLKRSM